MERKLAAILSADVQGYSRLVEDDDEETIKALTVHRVVMRAAIEEHHGRVVDTPGDNLLAEFASVVDAVRCAVELQKKLHTINSADEPHRRMEFRMGINVGDVVVEDNHIYGDGVNIAARLEGLAEAGGICLSGSAYDQIENKLDFDYEYVGEQAVKNISKPVRVWRIRMAFDDGSVASDAAEHKAEIQRASQDTGQIPNAASRKKTSSIKFVAIAFVMLAAIAAVTLVVLNSLQGERDRGHVDRAGPPTIAVLPFTTMSGDAEHEWMSDGLTEDIITLLARSPAMRIIARNSTFQYKGQSVDIRQVGAELGADFVVEGSLRAIGDRIRVTVQLIDAGSGTHVWADKYDRPLGEIFAVQDEVTTGIAAAVGDELFKIESIRATEAKAGNLDAWGQTWRAEASWSVDDAREAVALDPDYARAHAVLGRNLAMQTMLSTRDRDAYDEALRAARRAADLAPDDVIVLTHLGTALLWSGDPSQALKIMARVPSMSPSYAEGLVWYGDMLIHNGRPAEGLEVVNRGIKLTPSARMMWMYEIIQAEALVHMGRFEEAKTALQHATLDETLSAPVLFLAGVEAMTGNLPEAERLRDEARRRAPGITPAAFKEIYRLISTDDGGPNFFRLFESLDELWEDTNAP